MAFQTSSAFFALFPNMGKEALGLVLEIQKPQQRSFFFDKFFLCVVVGWRKKKMAPRWPLLLSSVLLAAPVCCDHVRQVMC